MKKLRLIVTNDCPRNCEGCCNKDYNPEKFNGDYTPYSEVLFTGGEPMLHYEKLLIEIAEVHRQGEGSSRDTKIIVYTASHGVPQIVALLQTGMIDGITYTLHEQADAEVFKQFFLLFNQIGFPWDMSMRLNIFKGITVPVAHTFGWQIKDNIEWIKDCPLPIGEELYEL